jgi:hypothetical protein
MAYTPAHPVMVEAVVTLSTGDTVTVEITERESTEHGGLYEAIFPSGVLTGHLVRTVQRELRAAREHAEAYAREES